MFNYDWFHSGAFAQQQHEAKWRCTATHYPDIKPEDRDTSNEFEKFHTELFTRTLLYLRDGFSYEVKEIVDADTKAHLVFECEPVDDQYKVGSFVVTLPFDEIVRVEVFAVHPSERPEELPQITGFRAGPDTDHKHPEVMTGKPAR